VHLTYKHERRVWIQSCLHSSQLGRKRGLSDKRERRIFQVQRMEPMWPFSMEKFVLHSVLHISFCSISFFATEIIFGRPFYGGQWSASRMYTGTVTVKSILSYHLGACDVSSNSVENLRWEVIYTFAVKMYCKRSRSKFSTRPIGWHLLCFKEETKLFQMVVLKFLRRGQTFLDEVQRIACLVASRKGFLFSNCFVLMLLTYYLWEILSLF